MTLKLYYDLLSQPSRALYVLLKLSKVPFVECPVALRTGAHLTDEYAREVSRFQKVPVLHDDTFKLTESVAILRYLANSNKIPDEFYPKDKRLQAKVDEYLEWQHNNTRAFCAMYFRKKWMYPILTGQPADPKSIAGYESRMGECLDSMETLWLASGDYIAGDRMTVADIWAACEIEQPRITGYDPTKGRPVLGAWLKRVRADAEPYYSEAHAILNKIVAKSEAKL